MFIKLRCYQCAKTWNLEIADTSRIEEYGANLTSGVPCPPCKGATYLVRPGERTGHRILCPCCGYDDAVVVLERTQRRSGRLGAIQLRPSSSECGT